MSGKQSTSSMRADDPRLGEFVNQALEELSECDIVDSDDEVVDPTFVIQSDHSSDSEVEQSDESEIEIENVKQNDASFLGNISVPPKTEKENKVSLLQVSACNLFTMFQKSVQNLC